MIEELVVCVWDRRPERDTAISRPSWVEVEEAIRALNNSERNDLYLVPSRDDPETYLCVGGGAGRYVVTGSIRNDKFPVVLGIGHEPSAGATEELVVGGQKVCWPANQILDLDTALRAARTFYETKRFEGGGVTWART